MATRTPKLYLKGIHVPLWEWRGKARRDEEMDGKVEALEGRKRREVELPHLHHSLYKANIVVFCTSHYPMARCRIL